MLGLTLTKKLFLATLTVVMCCALYLLTTGDTLPHTYRNKHRHHSKLFAKDDLGSVNLLRSNNKNNISKKYFTYKEIKVSNQLEQLSRILNYKLSSVTIAESKVSPDCTIPEFRANSCDGEHCLQTVFPNDVSERISSLVSPSNLQVPTSIQQVLKDMVRDIPAGVEFTILTAVSSNHFLNLQGFVNNVHTNVFPHFTNFTFILYNIGLSDKEREQVVRFCKCRVIDFPFDRFPTFVGKLLCYSWKPIIINAHIKLADIVLWADSSIRFSSYPSFLSNLLKRVKKRSVQIGSSNVHSPFRTLRSMYHFFGDEPCMYFNMYQVQATIGMFKNEFFVRKAVLYPWLACALNQNCMCPIKDPKKKCQQSDLMEERWEKGLGPIKYGMCHRYDQSAISLILHKLYQGYFKWVTFRVFNYLEIKRQEKSSYFNLLSGIS